MSHGRHLVVGHGPTAIFAAALAQHRGVKTTLITNGRGGMLAATPLKDANPKQNITVVPIFPPRRATSLSRLLERVGQPLDIETLPDLQIEYRYGIAGWQASPDEAGYLLGDDNITFGDATKSLGTRTEVLSRKQYGDAPRQAPMMLIRDKIARAYFAAHSSAGARVGYAAGESPYAAPARALMAQLDQRDTNITSIDGRRRIAHLSDGSQLEYASLTYTSDVGRLCELLSLPSPSRLAIPALFVSGTRTSTESTDSKVVYDMRPNSKVFRVALPTSSTWVAQLSLDSDSWFAGVPQATLGPADQDGLLDAVLSLIDGRITSVGPLTIHRVAYPGDPLPPSAVESLDSSCARANTQRFGRFAEWRYVDLHELEWDKVLQ